MTTDIIVPEPPAWCEPGARPVVAAGFGSYSTYWANDQPLASWERRFNRSDDPFEVRISCRDRVSREHVVRGPAHIFCDVPDTGMDAATARRFAEALVSAASALDS